MNRETKITIAGWILAGIVLIGTICVAINAPKYVPPSPDTLPREPMLVNTANVIDITQEGNCMGSGTTGVACLRTGRKFIGIENDPVHFATAESRLRSEKPQLAAAA